MEKEVFKKSERVRCASGQYYERAKAWQNNFGKEQKIFPRAGKTFLRFEPRIRGFAWPASQFR